ncbi:hypothetical protein BCR34DRAFT_462651, partial [Clohesyomyces aquaticus]
LRSDNLGAMKVEIPILELPRTFRDAFDVTTRLGYEYIWINPLYILQGNEDDRKKEAARMGDTMRLPFSI